MVTSDLEHNVWLEADKSYWVVGYEKGHGYMVLHDIGLKAYLPSEARFRIITAGKYDEASTIRIANERGGINRVHGVVKYEAVINDSPKDTFVAVQTFVDDQPLVATVAQVQGKHVDVSLSIGEVGYEQKITYATHYSLAGNELRQEKASADW